MAKATGCPGSPSIVSQIRSRRRLRRREWTHLIDPLFAALEKTIAPSTIILRNDAPARALEGLEEYVRAGERRGSRVMLEENGIRYLPISAAGQKTAGTLTSVTTASSWRRLPKAKCARRLQLYRGFGIAAAKAGAREVVCLDSSAPALALPRTLLPRTACRASS